jgi:tetratricopeptide (TPR) repeat protein
LNSSTTFRTVRSRPAAALAARALTAAAVAIAAFGPAAGQFLVAQIDKPAPAFALSRLGAEGAVGPATHKGRAVAVIFFRPGQERSETALADLGRVLKELGDKKCAVIAVADTGDEKALEALAARAGDYSFPVVSDPKRAVISAYGPVVLPATGVIDREGVLRFYYPGCDANYARTLKAWLKFAAGDISREEMAKALEARMEQPTGDRAKALRHLELSRRLAAAGLTEKALDECRAALKFDPEVPGGLLDLGYLLLDQATYEEAAMCFEKLLATHPRNVRARIGRGVALGELGQTEEAEKILTECVALSPRPEWALYELGKIHQKQGRHELAAREFRRALEKLLTRKGSAGPEGNR